MPRRCKSQWRLHPAAKCDHVGRMPSKRIDPARRPGVGSLCAAHPVTLAAARVRSTRRFRDTRAPYSRSTRMDRHKYYWEDLKVTPRKSEPVLH
jgi:hypothetical protein